MTTLIKNKFKDIHILGVGLFG